MLKLKLHALHVRCCLPVCPNLACCERTALQIYAKSVRDMKCGWEEGRGEGILPLRMPMEMSLIQSVCYAALTVIQNMPYVICCGIYMIATDIKPRKTYKSSLKHSAYMYIHVAY